MRIISDGLDAKVGTISSPIQRFLSWKTVDGEHETGNMPELDTMIHGMLAKPRLLDTVRNFVVFEQDSKVLENGSPD